METYASGDEVVPIESLTGKGLNGYLKKISKNLDQMAVVAKTSCLGEREKFMPELESLIQKLTSLYAEIKASDIVDSTVEAE